MKFFRGSMPQTPEEVPKYLAEMTQRLEEAFDTLTENLFSEKTWTFSSPTGTSGVFFYGGYYDFDTANNDFSPSITWGLTNGSYAAHLSLILGAATVDDLTIRVTGTSITDLGVRTATDTQDLVIPSGAAVDSYYEFSKKWLGQITISVVSGTPKVCNYGWTKYWDNANTNFYIRGVEALWLSGLNDNGFDVELIHHKGTGWTYGAGGPTYPVFARMGADHGAEDNLDSGKAGAWKRTNFYQLVKGSAAEGTLFAVTTTAAKSVEIGTLLLRISQDA